MLPFELKNWPIFSLLDAEFISNIHMVIVYGSLGDNAVILTKDKKVYALGTDRNRYCIADNICTTLHPIKINELCEKDIKTFTYGANHILALTKQGQVYSSISNDFNVKSIAPVNLHDKFIVDIASGGYQSLALTNEGEVYTWGDVNEKDNLIKNVTSLPIGKKVVSIACGKRFSMAVTDAGEVYSWGDNTFGQLGIGKHSTASGVHRVIGLSGVKIEKVVCGGMHTLALNTLGDLYTWGNNASGQLGIGDMKAFVDNPLQVIPCIMGKVLDVAASFCNDISVAMDEHNQMFIWGLCLGQTIKIPTLTRLQCFYDAFACFASTSAMHQPLILYGKEAELTLTDSLCNAFDDPVTSDLIVQVHGKAIHVHKIILKLRCQYFRTKFEEGCYGKNQSVIEVKEFSYNIYRAFLQYLYNNEVNLPVEDVIELLHLANTYSEDALKNRCMYVIRKGVTVRNVISLYTESIKRKIKEVEEYCFNFAIDNIITILDNPDFAKLDGNTVKSFVVKATQDGAFRK